MNPSDKDSDKGVPVKEIVWDPDNEAMTIYALDGRVFRLHKPVLQSMDTKLEDDSVMTMEVVDLEFDSTEEV